MIQQFEARIQTLTDVNQSKQSDIDSLRVEVERLSIQNPSLQQFEARIQTLIDANQSKQSQIDTLTTESQQNKVDTSIHMQVAQMVNNP